jgi:hypothetical protein
MLRAGYSGTSKAYFKKICKKNVYRSAPHVLAKAHTAIPFLST